MKNSEENMHDDVEALKVNDGDAAIAVVVFLTFSDNISSMYVFNWDQ